MPQDVIQRYEIPFNTAVRLQIPRGGEVLHFGCQGDKIYIWAQIDPDRPTVTRGFAAVETRTKIDAKWDYIGTCDVNGVIWHLYDVYVPRT